jgi:predicted transcriptional regulator
LNNILTKQTVLRAEKLLAEGLSRRVIAERLGVTRSVVSVIAHGKHPQQRAAGETAARS